MLPSGWEEGKVKDIVKSLDAGVSVNSDDNKDINFGYKILKTSCVSKGTFLPAETKSVVEAREKDRLKELLLSDSIIISRMNTPALVGATAYVEKSPPNTFLPDRLWQVKIKSKISCMRWLGYWFGSQHTRSILSSLATGTSGSMKNITKPDVFNIKINIPPPPEQNKIAQILSTWDKAISITESLIETSKQQKKSMMQQLLTGKKRFTGFERECGFKQTKYGLIPNDWQYVKISDIASQYTNKNVEDESYPVLSCSKHIGFVDSLKYFNKKVYSDDLTGYKLIPHGFFGFPSNHIEEGSIGCQNLYKVGL